MTRIWDGDERSTDSRSSLAIWGLLFLAIGTMILLNLPPTNAGWFIIIAGVAYAAAAAAAFSVIVRK